MLLLFPSYFPRLFLSKLEKILSNIMADIVVITVVIIVVPTISVGATDLYCIRIAITVVAISVNPDVFNAKKVIIDLDAMVELLIFFISSIAFNPIGVAAFPNPNIFAVIFDKI